MAQTTTTSPILAIGMDLGDFKTVVACLHEDDQVQTTTIRTSREDLREHFDRIPRGPTIFFEVGSCSRWVKEVLEELGHDIHIADPRIVPKPGPKKSDKVDAIHLARLGCADRKLLGKVYHRSRGAQLVMARLRARFALVEARADLTNSIVGILKSFGLRLRSYTTRTIHNAVIDDSSCPANRDFLDDIRRAITPLQATCAQLTAQIAQIDKQLEQISEAEFPETHHLRQIHGIGPITALYFVLLVENPGRFKRNRDIGAYLGLAPRLHESGTIRPQLGITKAGDKTMRRLLVSAAQCILRSNSPPSDLKSHGLQIAERGGGNAKKRGVVAVARKLSVLMLSMWKSGESWDANRNASEVEGASFMGKPAAARP